MVVAVIGGLGKLGSVMAKHIGNFYVTHIADKAGGETIEDATRDADTIIVIVNTPSLPDGRYDISNVMEACYKIDLSRWRMVMIGSTVNPGDVEGPIRTALERADKMAHRDFGLAYAPEFVRQGSVLRDFARPSFVIVGCDTPLERTITCEFYQNVCGVRPTFMSIASAEIAKIGLNTCLTAKLGKANEIAWLCQKTPGADARDVLDAIGKDERIGHLYFKAGPPDGGPCLPRDDLAFTAAWEKVELGPCWSEGVNLWRDRQIVEMATMVGQHGERVGIVGLSFKPGIADATESASIRLAAMLHAETYDPVLPSSCKSMAELVKKCDVIVLATPFEKMNEIRDMALAGKTVYDWWGAFGDEFVRFGKGPDTC